ncbi:6529_t:CDS:2, partial [Cetraspora pellucida]
PNIVILELDSNPCSDEAVHKTCRMFFDNVGKKASKRGKIDVKTKAEKTCKYTEKLMCLLQKKHSEYDLCINTSEDNIIEVDNKDFTSKKRKQRNLIKSENEIFERLAKFDTLSQEKTKTVLTEIHTLSDTKSEE